MHCSRRSPPYRRRPLPASRPQRRSATPRLRRTTAVWDCVRLPPPGSSAVTRPREQHRRRPRRALRRAARQSPPRARPPRAAPPVPEPRRKVLCRSLRHFDSAVLNWALAVLMPLVLKIGPLPEVFGVGTFTPFSRIHVANLTSPCLKAGLVIRLPLPTKAPPPHFLIAASYCARVTPFGNWGPPAAPPPPPRKPPAPPEGRFWPGVRFGSVMPFFCRHSRIAANRPAFGPLAPVAPVVVAADALVLVDELFEELPQAASPRQASRRTSTAAAAGLRL